MEQKEIQGRRVVFQQKGVVAVEEFKLRQPEPNEVLIRTVSTLISTGTETAFLMALPNTPGVFPQYSGYSNAGIVDSAGTKVSQLRVGDRVVSRGHHASYVLATEDTILKIPDGTSFDEATFFALSSIALQGIRKAHIEGDTEVNFYREIHRKGISIIGAHERTRPRYESYHGWWTQKDDSSLVLKLLSRGLLRVRDLITLKIGFQEAQEAYRRLIESKESVLGIILDWDFK